MLLQVLPVGQSFKLAFGIEVVRHENLLIIVKPSRVVVAFVAFLKSIRDELDKNEVGVVWWWCFADVVANVLLLLFSASISG